MAHYDEIYNEQQRNKLKDKKRYLRYSINKLSAKEVDFLMDVVVSIRGYMNFFALLKNIIKG